MKMSMAATMTRERRIEPAVAVGVSVAVFLLVQATAYDLVGAFEYPLDDVYIHLAVAEQIAAGGYGVNPGEYTSAASSPIYPFLLVPFVGTAIHAYVPLVWNVVALIACAVLWGRIVQNAVQDWRVALALAILGPLAFNLAGIAQVGMEHTLHVLAGLAVLRGLQQQLDDDRLHWLLVAGMVLGPLVRFEGLAITGGAALALVMMGRWKTGLSLFAVALALVAGFMAFLTSLGLEPLPNSVMAKLAGGGQDSRFSLLDLPMKLATQLLLSDKAIVMLFAVVIATVAIPRVDRKARAILAGAVFAGTGHLLLGQFGWFNRYELYALSFVFGMVMLGLFQAENMKSARALLIVGFAYLALSYGVWLVQNGKYGALGIYSQQRNMSTFVKEVYQKPVAVNDLGYVAWNNPNYVLDLWGLASYRALSTRLDNPYDGWADEIVKDAGVELAIIYDHWIDDGIGDDWVKVGTLVYTGARAFLGGQIVSFYATTPAAAPELRKQIADFAPRVVGAAELRVEDVP
ncbi:hypothetical protein SAMN05444851_2673 [Aliiroseovarius sediminilitoris]|uniref:4-amino-4-deoxy-L-arabinose transferase n=1 Tax=Aliiroseovarius sediminilitoris TaxID=1173584 RepID=A0A1I0QLM9_9RHOB|nr:hypothetical protein [Aliiroseovarius sediminilitoris]SEW28077.1 hypothetical protein SAMN05444851_2673 [Aliiroseovarius sediminilitoris]